MAIWRGVGGSGESTNDSTVPTVTALLVDAEAARDAAQLAETNAETAASNAASSASTASTQASNAATSATNAASSASSASTSATNAASSASTASTQASNAAASASSASTSATNAASSATSAASSASTATTKASEASTSATNAASSATAAASSASSAATQASNASTSATNAASSATSAASSASTATTQATNAANSASSASTSASNASTSATNAVNSASAASTSATNAASSATTATTQATNAASSASDSAASASLANDWATKTSGPVAGGEYSAKYNAQQAATSASNAATSASNASTSASNAATSATSAAAAQSAAETARDQTLAAFDSFDDRYLGTKSSAPTVDNDGNPLVAGALYFNTTTNEMKVYDGTQWLNAYASLSGALLATNNLSDLNNTATARTNLGVAIGTDVQAYDGDLAAIAGLAGTSGLLKKTAANTWSLDTSTYLTGNQTVTLSGDITGSGATAITTTLANSGVTAGTYTKVTVDAKGRVTVGAALASGDLPTYTGTITSSQVTTGLGYTPLNPTTSQTANTFYAAPNGIAGAPTFRAIAAADIPALSYAPTAGSTSITTLGTIGTGTWQGSVINSTYGGTGVNNGGRTLAINTNSGTIAFSNLSTTLTVANTASVSGTNTGDQTITLTGDVTGSGTGSFATTLANSGVTAGTYTKVTVDAKGRVTTGATLASADLPTYTGTLTSTQVTTALGYTPPQPTGTGASGTWGISITGSAASASTNAVTDDTTTNATHYLTFVSGISGNQSEKVSSTKLTYNPSTGTLSSTAVTASSDERLKTNWRELPDLIEGMSNVKNGEFDWLDGSGSDVGVSAQSLMNVLAQAVKEDSKGQLSVNYGAAALVTCIQLCKRVIELEKKLEGK